jgi:hypothetical protein
VIQDYEDRVHGLSGEHIQEEEEEDDDDLLS